MRIKTPLELLERPLKSISVVQALFLLLVYTQPANAQLGLIRPGNHVICDPTSHSARDFSGLRIQHQVIFGPVTQHHTRISLCLSGAAQLPDYYYPMNPCGDADPASLAWTTPICLTDNAQRQSCLKIARLPQFVDSSLSLDGVSPGTWVGGVYKCPHANKEEDEEECDDEHAIPLYPLVKDSKLQAFTQVPDGRHFVQRVPVVSTVLESTEFAQAGIPANWTDYISANENYVTTAQAKQHKLLLCSPKLFIGDGIQRRPAFS